MDPQNSTEDVRRHAVLTVDEMMDQSGQYVVGEQSDCVGGIAHSASGPSSASSGRTLGRTSKRRRVTSEGSTRRSSVSSSGLKGRADVADCPHSRAVGDPVLLIKQQPAHYGRFRYQAEVCTP